MQRPPVISLLIQRRGNISKFSTAVTRTKSAFIAGSQQDRLLLMRLINDWKIFPLQFVVLFGLNTDFRQPIWMIYKHRNESVELTSVCGIAAFTGLRIWTRLHLLFLSAAGWRQQTISFWFVLQCFSPLWGKTGCNVRNVWESFRSCCRQGLATTRPLLM